MPLYDYRCLECKNLFMKIARPEDRENIECEYCHEKTSIRVYLKFPGVTRRTYTDGTKRPGWEDLKQENKLEQTIADTDYRSSEYKEAKKELNARRQKTTKKS